MQEMSPFKARDEAAAKIAEAVELLASAYRAFGEANVQITREANRSGNRRQVEGVIHAAGQLPILLYTNIERIVDCMKDSAVRGFVERVKKFGGRAEAAIKELDGAQ